MPPKEKSTKNADLIIFKNKVSVFEKSKEKDKEILLNLEKNKTLESFKTTKLIDQSNREFLIALKNCQTYEYKLLIVKKYFAFLVKHLSSLKSEKEKRCLSIEYYKAGVAALKTFEPYASTEELKELNSSLIKDFRVILNELNLLKDLSLFKHESLKFQFNISQFHLHREHFGKRDKRVLDFIPDKWQIELMDYIDSRKSVLVSAPTSSGKTFASFYAIETVLAREDSNSVAVFVAPTKALVHQMLTGVYTRFKRIDPGKNKKLIGVFTREYAQNLSNCRVLLTVPECLDIIFFNKSSNENLVSNIKYIIFDEFQSLNDEQRGKIWERISLMCECPFLALSATISNPQALCKWLQSSKVNKSCETNSFISRYLNGKESILDLLERINLEAELKSNEFDQIENSFIEIMPSFRVLMKLKSLDQKQKKIIEILKKCDDIEEFERKLKMRFGDVFLIEYKQPSTEFVYYTFKQTSNTIDKR